MLTAIIFIIVLGVLVLVHEFGHFVVAERAGMKVLEFGFGFPPRLWSKTKGETTYSINWIPFGGFVRILGEDGSHVEDPRSFAGRGAWVKTRVILAGVAMNVVLAFVILTIAYSAGLRLGIADDADPARVVDPQVQIVEIIPGSPAEAAGLKVLDEIIALAPTAQPMSGLQAVLAPKNTEDVQSYVAAQAGQEILMTVRRGGEQLVKTVTPRLSPPEGQGPLGIALATTGIVSYPFHEAIWQAILMTGSLLSAIFWGIIGFFKLLITRGQVPSGVAGPIGIFVLTGQFARLGLSSLLPFVAQISLALAVFNIFPLVPLDGGRQLFIIIEKLRGRALGQRLEGSIALAGWLVLVTIFVFVTRQDIMQFF